MVTRGNQAIVVGASMAGMLAARVLSEFYGSVVVVERDVLPDGVANRRGVPQGRQPHILLAQAAKNLDALFPGILAELVAAGAPVWNDGDLSRLLVSFNGHALASAPMPDPAALVNYYPTRPLLECTVRRRLADYSNVTVLEGHDLQALTSTPSRKRVAGVRIARRCDGVESALPADLVVDATGRGSRTPVFLEELGYGRPREDELTVHAAYASQLVHLPDGVLHENLIAIMPDSGHSHGFIMFRGENDTWIIGVGAIAGEEPPRDREGILCVADELAPPHIAAAARASAPLAEVAHHRLPSNRWRRYDRMSRVPDGLLVLGDAVCSFNPIYGQGMTVASIESLILRDCLRAGGDDLPRRFARAAAKKVKVAWQTAVGSDLTLPQIEGPRPWHTRLTNAYLDRVMTAAETDPAVTQQFLRVTGMVDSPSALLRPSFAWRVTQALHRRQSPSVKPPRESGPKFAEGAHSPAA